MADNFKEVLLMGRFTTGSGSKFIYITERRNKLYLNRFLVPLTFCFARLLKTSELEVTSHGRIDI